MEAKALSRINIRLPALMTIFVAIDERPINLPDRQLLCERDLTLQIHINGDLMWKTFPRTSQGWRDVLELARGEAQLMQDISIIESACQRLSFWPCKRMHWVTAG